MRYFISFFLIICVLCVLFVGCEDNNADTGKQPTETTPVVDTTTAVHTTTVAPETTAVPDTTVLDTTAPDTTVSDTTMSVTTEPTPEETTDPWVVTAPAGDGWSGFH